MSKDYVTLKYRYKCNICHRLFTDQSIRVHKDIYEDKQELVKYLNKIAPHAPIVYHECYGQLGIGYAIGVAEEKEDYNETLA